jgi:hypothetical protein
VSIASQLNLIMARDPDGKMRMWACRGEGKGCARNRFRASKAPCQDCMGPLDESLRIDQVQALLAKGDA